MKPSLRLNLVLAIFILLNASTGEMIEKLSFSSPFLAHDYKGMLFIPNYDVGGSSVVKQSFLRITPDMKNQIGYIWSKRELNSDDFSLLWKFRVSGDDPKNFGEYLALHIDMEQKMTLSKAPNLKSSFNGIKVVIDTNPLDRGERSVHYDVALLVNNGGQNDFLERSIRGCNVPNLRMHEGRDDFNFLKVISNHSSYIDMSLNPAEFHAFDFSSIYQ